ncbi:homoserine kinase [Pontibacter ummariensis]|uniref:Homoserine kinase n=1 Tax=Pontibacter ummariensis TaxID=1610492 RepID=A0A239F8K4_9BACT|nr:homoserine kinase [Pontibacter ummariensis]PRY12390.1 homoserine kinase [Pontibacter ummariensis]SNS52818.1 homoserine kinase [Pontibacter ummariensis]
MKDSDFIKVFAPATVANVCCGFDVLGFALDQPGDEVWVRQKESPGVTISAIEGICGLSTDPAENVVGIVAQKMLRELDVPFGVELQLHKGMPVGSGLGSSAASSAAAAFAVNELMGRPFTTQELVPFAMEGERLASGSAHADNVAPSLLGGFVLVRSYDPLDVIPLGVPLELYCTVVHPQVELKTSLARSILKKDIPLQKGIRQWGNLAGLMAGLLKADYSLVSRSLHDEIFEPERAFLIPLFRQAKEAALEAGALGAGISGSGPSIFALSATATQARQVEQAIQQVYANSGIDLNTYVTQVPEQGARLVSQPTLHAQK